MEGKRLHYVWHGASCYCYFGIVVCQAIMKSPGKVLFVCTSTVYACALLIPVLKNINYVNKKDDNVPIRYSHVYAM